MDIGGQPKAQMQCSPISAMNYKKNKTCFSLEALQRLAQSWNETHKNHQIKIKGRSRNTIWDDLNSRLKDVCGTGDTKESCWVDSLKANSVAIFSGTSKDTETQSCVSRRMFFTLRG